MDLMHIILLVLLVSAIIGVAILVNKNSKSKKRIEELESSLVDEDNTHEQLIKDKNYYRDLYNKELDKRADYSTKAEKAENKIKAIHDDLVAYKKVWKSYEAAGIKKAISIIKDHCAEIPLVEDSPAIAPSKPVLKKSSRNA